MSQVALHFGGVSQVPQQCWAQIGYGTSLWIALMDDLMCLLVRVTEACQPRLGRTYSELKR